MQLHGPYPTTLAGRRAEWPAGSAHSACRRCTRRAGRAARLGFTAPPQQDKAHDPGGQHEHGREVERSVQSRLESGVSRLDDLLYFLRVEAPGLAAVLAA